MFDKIKHEFYKESRLMIYPIPDSSHRLYGFYKCWWQLQPTKLQG